jgi:hypothetical protein
MYCPSCGKETPEGSQFCSHCGKPITTPTGAGVPMQWEYKDYIWKPPTTTAFATPDMLSTARVQWWSEARPLLTTELQKWFDEGWQPVGSVGPDCMEIEETKISSASKWNFFVWIMWFLSLVPSFGLTFFALFLRSTVYKPVAFRVQMRAPKGTKTPKTPIMFSEGSVQVTTQRLLVSDKSFEISNLKPVQVNKISDNPPEYEIKLVNLSGESIHDLTSDNSERIQRIAQAINDAIDERA